MKFADRTIVDQAWAGGARHERCKREYGFFLWRVSVTMTRSTTSRLMLIVLLAVLASACGVIGGIFKAGFWAGAIIVILIVAVIGFVIVKAR